MLLLVTLRLSGQPVAPSLIVTVVDPSENEVEAAVALIDTNGTRIEKENERGGVKFEGLGVQPVTVIVGKPSCNQVTVRDVPLRWGETVHVKVFYNIQDCLIDLPKSSSCSIVIRVQDAGANPVPRPNIAISAPHKNVLVGDQFGRSFVVVPFGHMLSAEVSAVGMESSLVNVPCNRNKEFVDHFVTLRRVSR
jgi:hypothetical protein